MHHLAHAAHYAAGLALLHPARAQLLIAGALALGAAGIYTAWRIGSDQ